MTPDDVKLIKQNVDNVVRITCRDGEVILAKIDVVDESEGEVVYEMISTTNPSKYEKFDQQPAYLIHFREIAFVQPSKENNR
jgi:hypothetical protein